MTTTYLEVGGLRIAYRRAGEGPPLVLLNGFVVDGREWHNQLAALSDAFTVVAWDAPGSGGSDDPPESFRLPDYADCLAGLIRGLGLERPVVIGLSFGGALALELYHRHPDIPSALVVVSGYAGWAGSLGREVSQQRLRRSLEMSALPAQQFAEAMLPSLFAPDAAPEVISRYAAMAAEFHPAGYRAMARALAEADLREMLPTIRVPTLLLYGDQDQRAPKEVADALHASIPHSRLLVIEGSGHLPNLEAPGRVTAEIRRFIGSL